jgi:hypothetical protein
VVEDQEGGPGHPPQLQVLQVKWLLITALTHLKGSAAALGCLVVLSVIVMTHIGSDAWWLLCWQSWYLGLSSRFHTSKVSQVPPSAECVWCGAGADGCVHDWFGTNRRGSTCVAGADFPNTGLLSAHTFSPEALR